MSNVLYFLTEPLKLADKIPHGSIDMHWIHSKGKWGWKDKWLQGHQNGCP